MIRNGHRGGRDGAVSDRRRPGGRLASVVLLLLVGLRLAPDGAWAHATLVRSSPARRAVVTRPPGEVRLWFSERLEPAFSQVSVVDGDGRRVDTGNARVDPEDATRLSVGVPTLGPGTYTVRYRVLSVDGHIVESAFPFTVRAPR
jgi:methionine-rich copper-binding protein CopC